MDDLFSKHLFPGYPEFDDGTATKADVPVLDSLTRSRLYSVLLSLSTDLKGYKKPLSLTSNLVPEGENNFAWSCGYAQLSEDFAYEMTWNFDRLKAIRAPTGYVGMKNLANTCYLNSLLTQLFLNANFREFILGTNVTDREGSQRLLFETQHLFASLQESWLKCVDPESVANSIITYDGTPIHVTIQMDVDEFYNLLFDF